MTGLALNHSASLGLDRKYLAWDWLLDRYGIEGPELIVSFAAAQRWLSLAGDRLYLDGEALSTPAPDELRGAVALREMGAIALASTSEILLLGEQGELIDRNPIGLYLPGPIEAIAGGGDRLWIQSAGATFEYDLESGAAQLLGDPSPVPDWLEPAVLPERLRSAVEGSHRGNGLSVERVLADLHSGRLFALSGVIVFDLAAIALVVLAVSGLVIWFRR